MLRATREAGEGLANMYFTISVEFPRPLVCCPLGIETALPIYRLPQSAFYPSACLHLRVCCDHQRFSVCLKPSGALLVARCLADFELSLE